MPMPHSEGDVAWTLRMLDVRRPVPRHKETAQGMNYCRPEHARKMLARAKDAGLYVEEVWAIITKTTEEMARVDKWTDEDLKETLATWSPIVREFYGSAERPVVIN